MAGDSPPLAGEPRERKPHASATGRVAVWLGWWIALMSLWVAVDDSFASDELLAGAGAAAIAAFIAETACYQAALPLRLRASWLLPLLRLPGQVVTDTIIVYRALWRKLAHGENPPAAFVEERVDPGADGPPGTIQRTLLTGTGSFTPNGFVLGIDAERGVMIVHRLVAGDDRQ